MKHSITLKRKRNKTSAANKELLELQKKYGYSSFHLSNEKFKEKLRNSINKIRFGLNVTKNIIR